MTTWHSWALAWGWVSASTHTRFYLATCVQCSPCLLTHANLLKVYPSTGAQKWKRPSLGLSQQGRSWGPGAGHREWVGEPAEAGAVWTLPGASSESEMPDTSGQWGRVQLQPLC